MRTTKIRNQEFQLMCDFEADYKRKWQNRKLTAPSRITSRFWPAYRVLLESVCLSCLKRRCTVCKVEHTRAILDVCHCAYAAVQLPVTDPTKPHCGQVTSQ